MNNRKIVEFGKVGTTAKYGLASTENGLVIREQIGGTPRKVGDNTTESIGNEVFGEEVELRFADADALKNILTFMEKIHQRMVMKEIRQSTRDMYEGQVDFKTITFTYDLDKGYQRKCGSKCSCKEFTKLRKEKYWTTSGGNRILIKDIEDEHLVNIINCLNCWGTTTCNEESPEYWLSIMNQEKKRRRI